MTLGYGKPVCALDAATGQTVKTYAGTEGVTEIVYHDGALLLVVGAAAPAIGAEPPLNSPCIDKDVASA